MVELSTQVGGWEWTFIGEPLLHEALMMLERAVALAKSIGIWDSTGTGEAWLTELVIGARNAYLGKRWSATSNHGRAQIALGSAAMLVELWADSKPREEGWIRALQFRLVVKLREFCEAAAELPSHRGLAAEFPRYSSVVFEERAEVKPA